MEIEELAKLIYVARWVEGIKDPMKATDLAIAKKIHERISDE